MYLHILELGELLVEFMSYLSHAFMFFFRPSLCPLSYFWKSHSLGEA